MPTAQRNQSTTPNGGGLGLASRLPAVARGPLGRVGSEAQDMWKEARALSRRHVSTEQIHSDSVSAAWYAGLATMTALRVIEWQLAAVIAAAHTVERYGRRQIVREMAGGLDAGI